MLNSPNRKIAVPKTWFFNVRLRIPWLTSQVMKKTVSRHCLIWLRLSFKIFTWRHGIAAKNVHTLKRAKRQGNLLSIIVYANLWSWVASPHPLPEVLVVCWSHKHDSLNEPRVKLARWCPDRQSSGVQDLSARYVKKCAGSHCDRKDCFNFRQKKQTTTFWHGACSHWIEIP